MEGVAFEHSVQVACCDVPLFDGFPVTLVCVFWHRRKRASYCSSK